MYELRSSDRKVGLLYELRLSCGSTEENLAVVQYLLQSGTGQGTDPGSVGAIDLLKRSLKFNKLNVQARNLLGLVYFETGEAVAALSEWIISKNIMPENNIASEYIERLQQNANKLDVINQTIKSIMTVCNAVAKAVRMWR